MLNVNHFGKFWEIKLDVNVFWEIKFSYMLHHLFFFVGQDHANHGLFPDMHLQEHALACFCD